MEFRIYCFSRDLHNKGSIRASGYSTVADVKQSLFDDLALRGCQYEAKHFEAVICRNGDRTVMEDSSLLVNNLSHAERRSRELHIDLVLKS